MLIKVNIYVGKAIGEYELCYTQDKKQLMGRLNVGM